MPRSATIKKKEGPHTKTLHVVCNSGVEITISGVSDRTVKRLEGCAFAGFPFSLEISEIREVHEVTAETRYKSDDLITLYPLDVEDVPSGA